MATGVFPAGDVRLSGTLLQLENKRTLARQKMDRQLVLSLVFIVMVVGRWEFFNLIFRKRFTRNAVVTIDPASEINELTSFGAERTKRVVFPFYGFTAGRAFHRISRFYPASYTKDAGRLIKIRRFTNSIVPSRRMAFKRTVTLSRVDPTIEAISR